MSRRDVVRSIKQIGPLEPRDKGSQKNIKSALSDIGVKKGYQTSQHDILPKVAMAYDFSDEHKKIMMDHIDHLVNRGLSVKTMTASDCGHSRFYSLDDTGGIGHHEDVEHQGLCPSCQRDFTFS